METLVVIFNLFIYIGIPAGLLALGYFAGTMAEKRHYRFIEYREQCIVNLPTVTTEDVLEADAQVERVQLVSGIAVISTDRFKQMLAGLRHVFGGRMLAYESLIDRARREAILRMKEMALGADMILNLRIETVSGGEAANTDQDAVAGVRVIAYGTAVTLKKAQREVHAETASR
jgi:uncharacterized protein YbjQ (UPF0145 family)